MIVGQWLGMYLLFWGLVSITSPPLTHLRIHKYKSQTQAVLLAVMVLRRMSGLSLHLLTYRCKHKTHSRVRLQAPQVHGRCDAAEIVTLAFESRGSQSVASNGHASNMTAAPAVFHATQPGAITYHAHEQRQPSHARGALPPTVCLRAFVSYVLK
jgi:hypothetical protein